MDPKRSQRGGQDRAVEGRRPFAEPKLTFVSPQLVRRGGIAELTAGTFWGTFMSGAEYPPVGTGGDPGGGP